MTVIKCHDCGVLEKNDKSVSIRQCDWLLCDECEKARKSGAIRKKPSSNKESNGLRNHTKSPKNRPKTHIPPPKPQATTEGSEESTLQKLFSTPSKLLNSGFAAASALLFDGDISNSDIDGEKESASPKLAAAKSQECSSQECSQPTNPNQCKCCICQRDFHVVCVGLRRKPSQKTSWSCPECKADTNLAIKKLCQTITSLQQTVNELATKQSKLNDNQKVLCKENVELKRQLADMKENIAKLSKQSPNSHIDSKVGSATLIIGDSMLREFTESSVSNAKVKCVSGATVKDICDEINKMSDELSNFKNIIVHCGTNDVSKGTSIQAVADSMEAIVTKVMVKSPTSNVYISAICPRSCKTSEAKEYNQILKDLSVRLTCGFIDIGPKITYQDGSIDRSKYSDSIHLNSSGTQILINAFVAVIPDLKPTETGNQWTEVVKGRRKNKNNASHKDDKNSNRFARDGTANNKKPRSTHSSPPQQENRRKKDNNRVSYHQRNRSRMNRPNYSQDYKYNLDAGYDVDRDFRYAEYAGCWKCGLYNHNAETCFYKSKIQCRSCNFFGHKERYCTEK